MGVPPGNRTAGLVRGVPERYVAGANTRGRQEGRPHPWSQQVIHEISGLMTAAAIGGDTAAAAAGATSHPTAGCAIVSTTFETEY